jgi:hypothetical protein
MLGTPQAMSIAVSLGKGRFKMGAAVFQAKGPPAFHN